MTLAHQGGWDEALLVLGPIALVFLALWFANRRATRASHVDAPDSQESTTED